MPRDTTGKTSKKPVGQLYAQELLPGDIPKPPWLIAREGYGPIPSQHLQDAELIRKKYRMKHPYKVQCTHKQENLRFPGSQRDANAMSVGYPVKNLRAAESGRNKSKPAANLNTQDMEVAPRTAPPGKGTEAGQDQHPHPSISITSPHGKKHIFLSNGTLVPLALTSLSTKL